MELATAYVGFKPKLTGFKEETTRAAKETGAEAGTQAGGAMKKSFDQSATGMGVKTYDSLKNLFIGGAVVAGIKNIIDKASDLNETVSKVGVIFGEQKGEIISFADDAAKSLGQSKQQALDAAATFATFGKAAGLAGTDLVTFAQGADQLASDLASFFNTSPEQAIGAIGAAFRGESEPIRAYGVLLDDASLKQEALSQGLIKTTSGVLPPAARVQAAYGLIMKQTTDAQGDFARTADGAANSQRILAAEAENARAKLGSAILPVYTQILGIVTMLVEGFSALPEPIQLAIVALAAFAAMRGPVGGVLSVVKSLGPAMLGAHPALIATIGLIGALAIILSDSGEILNDSQAQYKGFSKAAQDMSKNLATAFSDLEEDALSTDSVSKVLLHLGLTVSDVQGMIKQGLIPADIIAQLRAASDGSKETEAAIDSLGVTLTDLQWSEFIAGAAQLNGAMKTLGKEGIMEAAKEAGATGPQILALSNALGGGAINATILSQTGIPLAATLSNVRDAVQSMKEKTDDAGGSLNLLNEHADDATNATATLAWQFDQAANAGDRLKNALDKIFGPAQTLADAEQTLEANVAALTKSITDNGTTLDITTEKGRANLDMIDKQVQGYMDYAVAMVNSGKSQEEATGFLNNHIAALRQQLIDLGMNETEVDAYIAKLGLTPENVTTAIELAQMEKTKQELSDHLKELEKVPKDKQTEIQALIDEGKFNEAKARMREFEKGVSAPVNTFIPIGRDQLRVEGTHIVLEQYGGPVKKGDITLVGEAGPELRVEPSDATYIPAGRTAQLLAGGTGGRSLGGMMGGVSGPLVNVENMYMSDDVDVESLGRMSGFVAATLGAVN